MDKLDSSKMAVLLYCWSADIYEELSCGTGFKQTFGRSHRCTSGHSPIFKYSCIYKEKEIEENKKKIKMDVELVSNRPLDLPYPQCTSHHSPNFKYSYKEKEIIDLKKNKWFRTWFQRDLWISHLSDALLSTHPSSNSYVPLDRGVSISASIKKNLIFVRNNNKTFESFISLRVYLFSYLDMF